MHIDDMEDFDLSKLHIYFDFCKTAAGRDRIFFHLLGNFCCQYRRIGETVIAFLGKSCK